MSALTFIADSFL